MRRSLAVLSLISAVSACSRAPNPTPDTPDAPAASAVHVAPPAASPPLAAEPPPAAIASARPAEPALPAAPATSKTGDGASAPVPAVKVVNIGMHIGGGPNDDATKEPIRKSVEPHFDAFKRCWGALGDGSAKGDFGLDLHIGKDGGKATVDHPRTALKGKPFTDCVVAVFEAIDFRKPKTGVTTVSYSLRFTPLAATSRRYFDAFLNGPRFTRRRMTSVPSRMTVIATSVPTSPRRSSATSCGGRSRTSCPSMLMISSPSRSPALAADIPGGASRTTTRPDARS